MSTNPRQVSFGGGQISPAMRSRTDSKRYGEALRTLRNFVVTAEGNATRRPGSQWLGYMNPATSPTSVKLVPFVTSSASGTNGIVSYVLAFETNVIRVWSLGKPVSAITLGAFAGVAAAGEVWTYLGRQYRAKVATVSNPGAAPASWNLLPQNAGELVDVYEIENPFSTAWDPKKLKFIQSGDTLELCFNDLQNYELRRYGHQQWAMSAYSTLPSAWGTTKPTAVTLSASTAADATHPAKSWSIVVTAISSGDTGEESTASTALTPGGGLGVYIDRPATYTWTPPAGSPVGYFIYRGQGGVYGFIGYSTTASFQDNGQVPDYSIPPPSGRNPFDSTGAVPTRNPRSLSYHQQRLWFGNSGVLPSTIWATEVAYFHKFDRGLLAKASDTLQFSIASTKFEEVRSLLSKRTDLLAFSPGGVWRIRGPGGIPPNPADGVDATCIEPVGASNLDPLDLSPNHVLYITDLVFHLREITLDFNADQVSARDLSMLAQDLFDQHSIVDACFTRNPVPTIWLVREDGLLLGVSYIPDAGQVAWSYHDTRASDAGVVKAVCSIPEGRDDALYLHVTSTTGVSAMERIAFNTQPSNNAIVNRVSRLFSDSAVVYDGRASDTPMYQPLFASTDLRGALGGAQKVKLTGANPGVVNVQSQNFFFSVKDVGAKLRFSGLSDQVVTLTAYVDTNNMTGTLDAAVPGGSFGAFITTVDVALIQLPAPHLPATGNVALIDGVVYAGIAGPTASYVTLPVAGYNVRLGVPNTAQLELLDLAQKRGEEKIVAAALFEVLETGIGFQVGEDFDNLVDWVPSDEDEADSNGLYTTVARAAIESTWNKHGRACLQMTDPLPVTVLAAIREVAD